MSKVVVINPRTTSFRRTVRKDGQPVLDKAGNPRVLEFGHNQPVEVTAEELEALRDDIGTVLHIGKPVEGKPVVKADGEATAKFVAETKELRAKQAAEAAKETETAKEAARQEIRVKAGLAPTKAVPAKGHDLENKHK